MAGITIASGSPPPVITYGYISETCYQGQMLQDGATAGLGAEYQIFDVGGEAQEDAYRPVALCLGAVNHRTMYDSTYKGQKCTYTTTAATMAADPDKQDAAMVQVALIVPGVTILHAPIYDGAFGTALTECSETVGSSKLAYTDTNNAYTNDIADDWGTMYVRSGANRGLYRIMTTHTTTVCTTTLSFPWDNATGDKFVRANVKRGHAHLIFGATANYIDGDAVGTNYYHAFVTKLDMSEAGKEWAEFVILGYVHAHT